MYKPKNVSERYSISEYIEDNDIFNSALVSQIIELEPYKTYIINRYQYRIDLIAADIYGSPKYSQILLLYNGLQLSDLSIGTKLQYPKLSDIQDLIKDISRG